MNANEIRHTLISVLLQLEAPVGREDLSAQCGLSAKVVEPVLRKLIQEGQVVEGPLITGSDETLCRWASYWEKESGETTSGTLLKLRKWMEGEEALSADRLGIDSRPVTKFHRFIIDEYSPPRDKGMLVFFQCSVRRPFSKSPSHGSMRRAIQVATGNDPARDFDKCPVQVVVLASRIGPVPYELEDTYPANVSSGGVKHLRPDHYARARPVLAKRMAEFLTKHGRCYERVTTFTDGRYAQVMEDARELAGFDFPILPQKGGPIVEKLGKSKPRT
ncbi:MAG: DUF5591 domain-containing protein, partial [Planctomycetota bacterium]|nr:DUF5591 domain-containing protein [Planctomycetota bacterium]